MNSTRRWWMTALLCVSLSRSLLAGQHAHEQHHVADSRKTGHAEMRADGHAGGSGHGGEGEHDDAHDAHDSLRVRLTPAQRDMAGVASEILEHRDIATGLYAPGEIRLNAYATSRVSVRIVAQVLERHVRLGDRVRQAQPLVTLSSVEMAQAQGDLLVAEREWQRVSKLGRKVVSDQRYTGARVAREQARARVQAYGMPEDAIRKLLQSGDASLADGRFQLSAPQDGTVIRDEFIVGELVEPGRVLFEISDESVLWVEASLTPDEAARVQINARAMVTTREHRVEGRVVQVHHAMDEDTRTLGVRIAIPNRDHRLHPGLFVDVRIDGKATERALAVPAGALQRGADGHWIVFVEEQDNVFAPREVQVLRSAGDASVIEGLTPGARIVTHGAFFLQSELAKSGFDVHSH